MENFLRERIRERLDALGMNPFEAATKAGQNRHFLSDLLIGKKDTIRRSAIPDLAQLLECDAEYLIGIQATPKRQVAGQGVVITGICEADVWRTRSQGPEETVALAFDPRFPAERQAVYRIRGHHADWLGMADGDYLLALVGDAVRDGDLIIFRRRREGGEDEVTARRVEGGRFRTEGQVHDLSGGDVVGRVTLLVRQS